MNQTQVSPQLGKFFYAVILPEGNPLPHLTGLDDGPLHLITYQDIAIVVSDYPLTTLKPVRKNISPYHQVTKALAERCTTIPARFGQIAHDGEEVLTILRHHYPSLRQELERLHQKVEMGVQVLWQVENLFEYLLQQDQSLKTLRDRLLHQSASTTHQDRIAFGGHLHDALQTAKDRGSQLVLASLRAVVAEAKVDEPTEEKMLMNGIFLVDKERQAEFVETVEKIAGLMGDEYTLKVDGPWVPFNFIEHIELTI